MHFGMSQWPHTAAGTPLKANWSCVKYNASFCGVPAQRHADTGERRSGGPAPTALQWIKRLSDVRLGDDKKKVDLETCRLAHLVPSWAAITAHHRPPPPTLAANTLPLHPGMPRGAQQWPRPMMCQERGTKKHTLRKESNNVNTIPSEKPIHMWIVKCQSGYLDAYYLQFLRPRNTCTSLVMSRHDAANTLRPPLPRIPTCSFILKPIMSWLEIRDRYV